MFPQLTLWINEKMLTAQDVSYDEARNLHSKWQKHQAFMAELASNKDWLDKIDKVKYLIQSLKTYSPTVYSDLICILLQNLYRNLTPPCF